MFIKKQLSTLLVAAAVSLSLGLAGCGGSSGGSNGSSAGGTGGGTGGTGGGTGGTGGGTGGTGGTGGGTGGTGGGTGGTGGGTGGSTGFSGVEGPLDPVQAQVASVLGDQIGGALPDPLGGAVQCADNAVESFLDAPDALLVAFAALPGGQDPSVGFNNAAGDISASVQDFAAKLQSTLMILAGQSTACDGSSAGGNPFVGTPLEPLGAPLAALIAGAGSAGDGGSGGDPDLTVVVATLTPLLDQLSGAFDMLPSDVTGAPVVGGLFATVQDLVDDLSSTLTSAGAYDAPATETAVESLLANALGNVLTGVLPVGEIDTATGQDFTTQINDGITTLTDQFGTGLGMVITPLFNDALDGALEPVLDPVEGLLTQLLAAGAGGTGNPLDGILGALAGDGASPLDAFLALLTGGADGNTLAGLTQTLPGGGATGTPLDTLLALADVDNADGLDNILGALSTILSGSPLGGLLGGILGGLLP